MIQFNLLPDVKLDYVKAQRTKRMVIGSVLAATATTFAIFALLLLTVYVVQKKSLNDLNDDIAQYSSDLKATPGLNKILTIQNQLGSLTGLHDQKPVASRVFKFVEQVTPADVTISDLLTDFDLQTMTITGEAPSLDRINTFVDTLKFVTYAGADNADNKAFSDVVLSQFTRTDQGATYTITLTYNPVIFSNEQAITLTVPKTVTTRSIVEQPTDIFKKTDSATNPGSN